MASTTKYSEKQKEKQEYLPFMDQAFELGLLSHAQIMRYDSCSTMMDTVWDKHFEDSKVFRANTCGLKYCPICAKVKSGKKAEELETIINYLVNDQKLGLLSMGFTVPNLPANATVEDVKNLRKQMDKALKNLMRDKDLKKFYMGHFRKAEITYSDKNGYHPHLHVLIAVKKNYFFTKITHAKWLKKWRHYMDDESITNLYVSRLDTKDKESLTAAIRDLSKYTSKEQAIFVNYHVMEVLWKALKGSRMETPAGIFSVARKLYRAGELKEFRPQSNESEKTYVWYMRLLWNHKEGRYDESPPILFTDFEMLKHNSYEMGDAFEYGCWDVSKLGMVANE